MIRERGFGLLGCGFSIVFLLLLIVGIGILLSLDGSTGIGSSLTRLIQMVGNLESSGYRQVQGPVIALSGDGGDQAADLFMENWQLWSLESELETDYGQDIPIYWSVTHVQDGERTIRWETKVGTDDSLPEVNMALDRTTIYLSVDDRLQALRQADGELLWEAPLSDLVQSRCSHCVQVVDGRIIVLSVDQVLQALDSATGETIWQTRLNDDSAPSSRFGSTGFAVVDQQVLVIDGSEEASHVKELWIYNAETGTAIRQLSPTCPHPEGRLPDRALDWQSPVLVDEGNNQVYFIISGPGISPCVQSWDLSSGQPVWQARLPEDTKLARDTRGGLHINPSGPWFLLGEESLYVPVETSASGGAIVRYALSSGQSSSLLAVEDFATTPLGEQGGTLIVRANRTRGSDRTELWGLDRESGERLWQHELEADALLNVDPSIGQEWAYRIAPRTLTVIQQLVSPDRLQVQMIDVSTGRMVYETSSEIDETFWTGATWTKNAAYLTIRNLYSVDLHSGELFWEWP